MELPERIKSASEYRFISKNNVKLSKLFKSVRMERIKVREKNLLEDGTILRGDLAPISFENNTILCENAVIHPSLNQANAPYEYKPISIGKFTYIGKNSIISSLKVGDHVYIGENCILSDRTKVGDNVKILDNTYVPCDMVLLEYGIYEGYPARLVGRLDEQHEKYMEFFCNDYYDKLISFKFKLIIEYIY